LNSENAHSNGGVEAKLGATLLQLMTSQKITAPGVHFSHMSNFAKKSNYAILQT
jgi:hypothetical protein